jgi:hypothetical protein
MGLHATHIRKSVSGSRDSLSSNFWSSMLAAIHRNQSMSSARNSPKVRGLSRSYRSASSASPITSVSQSDIPISLHSTF